MPDQADGLRQLVRSRTCSDPGESVPRAGPSPRDADPSPTRRCRTVVVTAGKGGVGASVVALNLAVALARRTQRVLLVDADLGAANIDLLAGLAPRFDLGDVLAGDCPLLDAAVPGPAGIRVVAGAHAARLPGGRIDRAGERLRSAVTRFRDDPKAEIDFLLIDAGSGLRSTTTHLASLADEVIVVAGPEPTAILDTHAALARLGRLPPAPIVRVIANRVRSPAEGRAVNARLALSAYQFQGLVVDPLGLVHADRKVERAVRAGNPVVGVGWPGRAARDLKRVADALLLRGREAERPARRVEAQGDGWSRWATRWGASRAAL